MWIQRQFDPPALGDPEQLATINRKVAEFYAWVRPLIERRRESPADDLISTLITAEEEGDRLSGVELENLVLNILVGGVDTSQSQLAHALRLLAARPDQWAALRADPEALAIRAVDEAVRFEPITPFTARLLTEDLTYDDVDFPAGTVVSVCAFTGEPRPRGVRRPRRLRHHGRAGQGPHPDVRRRHPLLRRPQPRPGRDRRGSPLPGRADRIARAGRRGRAAERERDLRRRDVAGRVHGRLTGRPLTGYRERIAENVTKCPGCGLLLPVEDGPVHAYIGSSPACWRRFGEVLAREFQDEKWFRPHQITTDAYAVQHPGLPERRSIQSVALHLMTLGMVLERRLDPALAPRLHRQMAARPAFTWLEPPSMEGRMNVVDVLAARDPETHQRLIRQWAADVWEAWSPHHETIWKWVDLSLGGRTGGLRD